MVKELPEVGLPPAHVGVAAGPVVVQGGDYFGRTVNLAARIAAHAGAGQVLVSQRVAESASPQGVAFVDLGEVPLKGSPVRCGYWRPAGNNVVTPPLCLGEACGCQVFGHVMPPARTHGSAHRGDLVARPSPAAYDS